MDMAERKNSGKPAAPPAPEKKWAIVKWPGGLNLRHDPSKDNPEKCVLDDGQRVLILDDVAMSSTLWTHVQTEAGDDGYVMAEFLVIVVEN